MEFPLWPIRGKDVRGRVGASSAHLIEEGYMRVMVLATGLALGQTAAAITAAEAASVSGPAALALAGVIAQHSSVLGSYDQRAVRRLFDGNNSISFPPNRKISVKADSAVCRASDVDVTARSCELVFGAGKRSFKGQLANEVFATLVAAGIASEGAAGSIIESVKNLVCTLDPNEIKQKAGGGADCRFDTGP
jgi:hypothetical protein